MDTLLFLLILLPKDDFDVVSNGFSIFAKKIKGGIDGVGHTLRSAIMTKHLYAHKEHLRRKG